MPDISNTRSTCSSGSYIFGSPHLISTVMGWKPLTELGVTLVHEHLTSSFLSCKIQNVPYGNYDGDQDLCLSNIGHIKRYPYFYSKNLCLSDADVVKYMDYELSLFKFAGGSSVVETSSYGLKRSLQFVKLYSQTTGINILVGTGYYTAMTQSTSELSMTWLEMYDKMMSEFVYGIKDSNCIGIYPAFIGEVGSSWPIHDFERQSIIATGEVQEQLHCPVSFSPGCNESSPMEILRIYQEAGGNACKVIMSHADRTFTSKEKLMEFIDDTNCFVLFDSFGVENSTYYNNNQFSSVLSDIERIQYISDLKQQGKLNRILMSQDIHTKNRLISYGGSGYSHILNNIIPRMLKKDFNIHEIDKILINNPRQWLSLL
nr:PREDICTED: phosphotriesterase-related protein-like [Linepithema humile]